MLRKVLKLSLFPQVTHMFLRKVEPCYKEHEYNKTLLLQGTVKAPVFGTLNSAMTNFQI